MTSTSIRKLGFYTLLALIAFAGNSVLGRIALSENAVDPTSFTVIRLYAGALVLWILHKCTLKGNPPRSKGSWRAACMLFLYAVTFSYAYRSLETGTGALVLFGAVQITTLVDSLLKGNSIKPAVFLGMAVALLGFIYLVKPSLSTPSLTGFLLMLVAGIAWTYYTLFGSGSLNPLRDTAHNFVRTIPLTIPLILFSFPHIAITPKGSLLALSSGALTSGLGYAIWYRVLKDLKPISAAVIQLTAPVLATAGGIFFAAEPLTTHFIIASFAILTGALIVILSNRGYKKACEQS
ncbi:DMT family transporter [Rubritalea spongiae]|uniref:DMT family transporter n=1 Tax=Rubritalea spongiae TaxID=430797 RepID=A0ABW5E2E6_9BACT